MKTDKVIIAGKELTLYERRAKDVLDLADFLKVYVDEDMTNVNVFVGMQILLACLKPNIDNLNWYQIIKKNQLKKIINYNYLVDKMSVVEMNELVGKVYVLEGMDLKKKIMPEQESESAEKFPVG